MSAAGREPASVRVPGVGVLVRNEARKALYRAAFWVSLLAFLGIFGIMVGDAFYRALNNPQAIFRLPESWPNILLELGPLPAVFASVAVILLIGSEFGWRTARQNVIDGLSKDQWFLGKVLMLLMVVGVFLGGQILLGGGLALVHTDLGSAGSLVTSADVSALAGLAVTCLGYTSLGFLAVFITRSSGSGMGLFFLYFALLENVLGAGLNRVGEWGSEVTPYLPLNVLNDLFPPLQHYPEAREAAIRRALENGRPPPEIMDTGVLMAVGVGWALVFVALAYLVYRPRDL